MKIAVIGAGAVGGYFGGRLAASGSDVTFLVRGKTLEVLRSGPLRVKSINGDFERPVRVTNDPGQIADAGVVLVAVKAWQVPEAAESIREMAAPDSIVVPLQNGMEAPGQLAAFLGPGRVAGGLCRIVAEATGPGEIDHYWAEPSVEFGELEPLRNAERLGQLRDAFAAANVRANLSARIATAMWEKFLFITPWGSLGAVTRLPVGAIRSNAGLRAQLESALGEVTAIARKEGGDLGRERIERTLAILDGLPPETTSSMQRDIMAGRPSELEAQTGAVGRFGARNGVSTPVHDAMYAELAPLERKARGGEK